jgi:hypothetical protein
MTKDDLKDVETVDQLSEVSMKCPNCGSDSVALGKRDRKTARDYLRGVATQQKPQEESVVPKGDEVEGETDA